MRKLATVLLALALASPLAAQESKKFEKSFTFTADHDQKIGIKSGEVTLDYFKIRHWPDPDDFRKGEKDLNDKHTIWIEFHYSNRDLDNNYKCHYTITIPGGKDGQPFATDERTATLDKGKIDDVNRMSLKMRTHEYKLAKTIKITFEIWRKS
jgi:hypothetical protein